jgi:ketosteroid isomerase-like protein
MQRLRKVVVGVCGVALLLTSTARTGVAQQGTPEQQVIQLERDWCQAALKKDSALLGRILADDYTGVGSRGKKETKSEALADLPDKTSTVTACVDTDVKVRVYNDAAVATGLGTRSGTNKGVAFKDWKFFWTDTFIKKDGRWQCVASQGTPIAAPQKD